MIRDPGRAFCLKTVDDLLAGTAGHPKWANARFAPLKFLSPTDTGGVGLNFLYIYLRAAGFAVDLPSTASGRYAAQARYDISVAGLDAQLKTATEDSRTRFQFNHVDLEAGYRLLVCIGVSPNDLKAAVWPRGPLASAWAASAVGREFPGLTVTETAQAPRRLVKIVATAAALAPISALAKAFAAQGCTR